MDGCNDNGKLLPELQSCHVTEDIRDFICGTSTIEDIGAELVRTVFDPGITRSSITNPFTDEELLMFENKALAVLNEATAVGEFNDNDLDLMQVMSDTNELNALGLEALINNRTAALRKSNLEMVLQLGAEYPQLPVLLDLLTNGAKSFCKPNFVPNGGSGKFKQSKSYFQWRALCNRHMFKLQAQGRAVILPWKSINVETQKLVHLNSLILAPSSNPNKEGRCCLNASYRIKLKDANFPSLNEGTDLMASDDFYKPTVLPTLRDLCDRAMEAKVRADRDKTLVVGATIDVADAYRQITLTYESTLHRAVMIYLGDTELEPHVVFIVVNNFGDTRAGHIYNVAGKFVDFVHRNSTKYEASETYIDDTIIFESQNLLEQSRMIAKNSISAMFTESAIKPAKDIVWGQQMVALGWHFDLREDVWRVAPKEKGLQKLYGALFCLIPKIHNLPDQRTRIRKGDLRKVAAILTWYSAVFEIGKPFVQSFWRNIGWGLNENEWIILKDDTMRDVLLWRAIILLSMRDPHIFSSGIERLASKPSPQLIITSDASKLIGGGAWIVLEDGQKLECIIRWTPEELNIIKGVLLIEESNDKGISINILEFFVVMYAILLWGKDHLKGKVIQVNCDNTSAVSWILKQRGSNKAPIGEFLVQIFVLYSLSIDCMIIPKHFAGILNTHADFLSRSVLLQEQLRQEVDTRAESWWNGLTRQEICRSLLSHSIMKHSDKRSVEILKLVRSLH